MSDLKKTASINAGWQSIETALPDAAAEAAGGGTMREYRAACKDCGEHLEGDGYTRVIHCPDIQELGYDEPDAVIQESTP